MGEPVTDGEGLAVAVWLPVVLPVPLADGVPVRVAVAERLLVADSVAEVVAVAVTVAERLPVAERDAVAVPVAERDGVRDGVAVREGVPVGVPEGGNACTTDRAPRPRTGRPSSVRPVGASASRAAAASQLTTPGTPPPALNTTLWTTPLRDCMSGTKPVMLAKSRQLAYCSLV